MASKTTVSRDGTIEISPEKPSAVVVFAHGLGDTAHGWADAMAMLSKELPHVKFVLPTATEIPVTINNGARMTAWFDVKAFNEGSRRETPGIDASRERLFGLIEKEVAAGVPHSRIVLGGFSQGGAMSLFTGFQMKAAVLAGVLCLSGRIPKASRPRRIGDFEVAPETHGVPLLMCHGELDPVVQYAWSQQSRATLAAAGVRAIEFRAYAAMRHSVCAEEMDAVQTWLQRVLPPLDGWVST